MQAQAQFKLKSSFKRVFNLRSTKTSQVKSQLHLDSNKPNELSSNSN